ncbi:MAG: DUF1592 domain-containing protein, partial [Planctomycetaceae bacterium]|nr:DUF1592 domain-containing protein [Planctomycetaceae bacterium]
ESDLRLDTLQADFDSLELAESWIEVMDNLNLGEMPPEGEPRPEIQKQRKVVGWIAEQLRLARKRKVGNAGQVLLRRMNRAEYSNTIRDLFQMQFLPGEDPADLLPPDASFEGFQKVGSALMLDSSLLGNYYEAARRVAQKAIITGPPKFSTHLSHFEMEDMAKKGSGFTYVCGHTGTECGEHDVRLLTGNTRTGRGLLYPGTDQMIPTKGFYTIRVRASADPGESQEPVRMFVERMNGREGRMLEVDVTAPRSAPKVYSVTLPLDALPEARGVYMMVGIINGAKRKQPNQLDDPERAIGVGLPEFFTFEKAMKEAASKGNHAESLRLAARRRSEGWTGSTRPGKGLLDPTPLRKLYIDWIEIEGPLYEQWPPRSHKALFFKEEKTPKTLDYAREIFTQFLPRAFRRPAQKAEVNAIVELIGKELERGTSFEEAIRLGVTYVLTSPSFLYLAEPTVERTSPRLTDYELASRLSYFLWSSMPDQRLFDLAAEKRLHDPKVLSQEVDRMLKDPKSQALVEGFAVQWLKTDEFLEFQPDQKIYAEFYRNFDPKLREYTVQETLAFFEEILRKDLSVRYFLDSDFVMVNGPLAEFYGLKGVKGEEFRRVMLPRASQRGGLLGQAGVHLRGSDGIRTKPVNRGVYVREVLFNDPPDPPPPNAGEVEPNIEGERLTVRQRLIQHQQIESCASCHRGIDPYGLALENFDVTGAWRDRQNGEEFRGKNTPSIDASGRLPNGQSFKDFQEFKQRLLEQEDRFRRGLIEKLFLYALGRPAMASDRGTIDEVATQMTQREDTLRTAIQALIATDAFQSKSLPQSTPKETPSNR